MGGEDDKKTPPERPVTRPGTGYAAHRPPQGREFLTPLPPVDDFSERTPPPTSVGKRAARAATPPPMDGVPEEVDARSDISAVSQRVDRAVRRAVATLPPPEVRITSTDVAKVGMGLLATLLGALVIGTVTKACSLVSEVQDRPTRQEVREDIRRATTPLGDKLDRLLERRP